MASKEAKATKTAQGSAPVDLLTTDAAKLYTHVHPLLVLSVFLARFQATVFDPVSSLAFLLIPSCILQVVYCGICVPQGAEPRPTPPPSTPSASKSPQPQRRKPKPSTLSSKLISAVLSTILALTISTVPLFLIVVLHGAPITTHHLHTLLLASHLAALATVPLFYAHGVSSSKWRELCSLAAPIDDLMGAAIGTLLGAWVGAVPIPLDWDREWQKWPVTVVTGAYLGWAVGKVLGGTLFKGKKIVFD